MEKTLAAEQEAKEKVKKKSLLPNSLTLKLLKRILWFIDDICVHWNNKQLLDEVFVISRIIEVELGVISRSRSRRLRLITLTETSIILDIKKAESSNFIIHWTEKKLKSCYCYFAPKARELDMITLRNHATRSYMTWLPVTLSVLDMIIVKRLSR